MIREQLRRMDKSSIFDYSRFEIQIHSYLPLRFEDSQTLFASYPFCKLGMLTAQASWGTHKGVAFVVQDNYLLTCASNCYSHQHGEYPNINFTINSNRKHGFDTYTIAQVFIPQQYKNLCQDTRKQFNYALLQIEGQPHLRNKYGFIKIGFKNKFEGAINTEDLFNNRQIIQLSEYLLQNYPSVCLSGAPFLDQYTYQSVESKGLIVENGKTLFSKINFDLSSFAQLQQWTKDKRTNIRLRNMKFEDLSSEFFSHMHGQAIQLLELGYSSLDKQQLCQFFEQLPVQSISALQIYNDLQSLSLAFLSQEKFKDLKELCLIGCKDGSQGWRSITQASLNNLRVLDLFGISIGKEGCKQVSYGKWPSLQILRIGSCDIQYEGFQQLCMIKSANLDELILINNKLDTISSSLLQRISCSYIRTLKVVDRLMTWESFSFLKLPRWLSLKKLSLKSDKIFGRFPIGNKGCKMIKESGIPFHQIELCNRITIKENWQFDDIGVKWFCKANLGKLKVLKLANSQFGNRGCYQFSKANFPLLSRLVFDGTIRGQVRVQGLKWLFKTGWTDMGMFGAVLIILFLVWL